MKFKKRTAIITCIILLIIAGIPLSIYGYRNYKYEKYYDEGLNNIKKDKLSNAAESFNKALSYKGKNKKVIVNKLNLIKRIKESKLQYDSALKSMKDKKYLDAIMDFKKVSKEDKYRYMKASDKIAECSKNYIDDNLSSAKDQAKGGKYNEALAFLDDILKFDGNYSEAVNLKKEYNSEIQKIKEAEEKKIAEEKQKEEERRKAEEKKKLAMVSSKKVGSGSKNTSGKSTNKTSNSEIDLSKIVPTLGPSPGFNQKSYYTPSEAHGIAAINSEYKKMGFVFKSDTTAIYESDGIKIGLLNRGDFYQFSTETWGDGEETLFQNCMIVILGKNEASNSFTYINYALDDPGSEYSNPYIKAFVQDGTLVVYVYIPK